MCNISRSKHCGSIIRINIADELSFHLKCIVLLSPILKCYVHCTGTEVASADTNLDNCCILAYCYGLSLAEFTWGTVLYLIACCLCSLLLPLYCKLLWTCCKWGNTCCLWLDCEIKRLCSAVFTLKGNLYCVLANILSAFCIRHSIVSILNKCLSCSVLNNNLRCSNLSVIC